MFKVLSNITMGSTSSRNVSYLTLVNSVFENLSSFPDNGVFTVDLQTMMNYVNEPVKICVDVNLDDQISMMKIMNIEIQQDVILSSENENEHTWVRTKFRFIKEDNRFTDLQLDAINEGIRMANSVLAHKYKN